MPEIKYCRDCRRIFQYTSGPVLCAVCRRIDEEEYDKVRTFLRDFPGANMKEVSDNTGVSPNKISRWLKEERLEVSAESPIALNCESCGIRIRSGRFCVDCSRNLAREMMNAGRELKNSLKKSPDIKGEGYGKDQFGLYYKHKEKFDK
ncbi:MAG: flagellar operon protein YvyF [Clostridiaceae bacterium]|jgi:flagellar operon protein (TIGR03826 family)|nr:flagellar operon protein YvyF [Clostridiaceae bacterium]